LTTLNIRTRAAAALALALALAIPGAALAVETGGTTTESLSIASAISFTAPASVTYSGPKVQMSAAIHLTAATDHGSGMTITLLTNADGFGKIVRASRAIDPNPAATGGLVGNPGAGTFTSTPWLVAQSSGQVVGGTVDFVSYVDASAYAGGDFTGSLDFVAATK
jgi:hypothetical protein